VLDNRGRQPGKYDPISPVFSLGGVRKGETKESGNGSILKENLRLNLLFQGPQGGEALGKNWVSYVFRFGWRAGKGGRPINKGTGHRSSSVSELTGEKGTKRNRRPLAPHKR